MVGRVKMPKLAGMADQAHRLAEPPRHRCKTGIVDEKYIGIPDGSAKLRVENRYRHQVKADCWCRHRDKPDALHARQHGCSHCIRRQKHDMPVMMPGKSRRIGRQRGGDAALFPVCCEDRIVDMLAVFV